MSQTIQLRTIARHERDAVLDLLDEWISTKRKDIEDMRAVPHPWEVARYYDI